LKQESINNIITNTGNSKIIKARLQTTPNTYYNKMAMLFITLAMSNTISLTLSYASLCYAIHWSTMLSGRLIKLTLKRC